MLKYNAKVPSSKELPGKKSLIHTRNLCIIVTETSIVYISIKDVNY